MAFFVIAGSALLWVALIAAIGYSIRTTIQARSDACHSTLVALAGLESVAEAGIRPVVNVVPEGISAELRAAFLIQRNATQDENMRRRFVASKAKQAQIDLKKSSFCR